MSCTHWRTHLYIKCILRLSIYVAVVFVYQLFLVARQQTLRSLCWKSKRLPLWWLVAKRSKRKASDSVSSLLLVRDTKILSNSLALESSHTMKCSINSFGYLHFSVFWWHQWFTSSRTGKATNSLQKLSRATRSALLVILDTQVSNVRVYPLLSRS